MHSRIALVVSALIGLAVWMPNGANAQSVELVAEPGGLTACTWRGDAPEGATSVGLRANAQQTCRVLVAQLPAGNSHYWLTFELRSNVDNRIPNYDVTLAIVRALFDEAALAQHRLDSPKPPSLASVDVGLADHEAVLESIPPERGISGAKSAQVWRALLWAGWAIDSLGYASTSPRGARLNRIVADSCRVILEQSASRELLAVTLAAQNTSSGQHSALCPRTKPLDTLVALNVTAASTRLEQVATEQGRSGTIDLATVNGIVALGSVAELAIARDFPVQREQFMVRDGSRMRRLDSVAIEPQQIDLSTANEFQRSRRFEQR